MHHTLLRRTILASTGVAATWFSPAVLAHISTDGMAHLHSAEALSSFAAGLTHPLTGADHLAAMVSVGLWSVLAHGSNAKPNKSAMWAAPVAFALTLLTGAIMGLAGVTLPGVEPMIAASLLVLGLLVATRVQLSARVGTALVAGFALFHGLAHGSELGGHALTALSGMVMSTAALHGTGMALGLALRDRAYDHTQAIKRWTSRAAGAAVALFGLSLLTPAIASVI